MQDMCVIDLYHFPAMLSIKTNFSYCFSGSGQNFKVTWSMQHSQKNCYKWDLSLNHLFSLIMVICMYEKLHCLKIERL